MNRDHALRKIQACLGLAGSSNATEDESLPVVTPEEQHS